MKDETPTQKELLDKAEVLYDDIEERWDRIEGYWKKALEILDERERKKNGRTSST